MTPEYYITRLSETQFKIAKFLGGEQPENVYHVTLVPVRGKPPEMRCDCPNRRRGKGTNDKHGQMVAKWILQGEPQGAFDDHRPFVVPENYGGPDEESAEGDDDPNPDC